VFEWVESVVERTIKRYTLGKISLALKSLELFHKHFEEDFPSKGEKLK